MKINNINKSNLLLIENTNQENILVTKIPINDLRNNSDIIICIGEKNEKISTNFINKIASSILLLLSLSQSYQTHVLIMPFENFDQKFPNAIQYQEEKTSINDLEQKINNNNNILDDTLFLITLDEDKTENECQNISNDLINKYPNIKGLVLQYRIRAFYI